MFAMSRAAFAAAKTPTRTALVAVIALTLAACSSGADTTDSTDADSLTVTDTWVKAIDSGMTAAFGEVTNSSDHEITIVSATSTSATMVELHEVVDDVMSPIEGGFVIPAGGTLTLAPGGFHIMFMGVTAPIVAGDDVTVTLTLADGSELTFTTVAKDFSGANEDYDGGTSMEPSDGTTPSDGTDMDAHASMSPSASMDG